MKKWATRIAKSKTMLFSIALALCGVVEASTGFLQTVMSPESFGWLMLGIGAVSAVLRVRTTQPLSDK